MAPEYIIGGISLLYFACIALILAIHRKRRKTRWPFKESDKLLRGPGEGLRQKIGQFGEEFVGVSVAVFLGTSFVGFAAVQLVKWEHLAAPHAYIVLYGAPAAFVVLGAAWAARRFIDYSNWYLGWYGERMAAECLRPLQRLGYHVFHDVPAEPGMKGFNIDHVVVGPTGVTVVEVKTRRKGNAKLGREEHKVDFDGTKLIWPWGDDRSSVQQAINEANWLEKWIESRTGLKVPVRPIVTLPGWWVNEAPSAVGVRVVNPKILPDAVRGKWPTVLTAEQVDLIARQLEIVCRDVEE